jgi:virginiamycin A acetyltransferase
MGLETIVDRLLVSLCRDQNTSRLLRKRFKRRHDIEIGMHSFGAFDRWRMSRGTRIGRYCSIANTARIVDANHPLDALSTHPSFYLKGRGLMQEDQLHIEPTVLEDDVWMSHFSILTPGCKRVGRGAIIGAGAVVTRNVPPYAVMVGAPAKAVRFRFSPEIIEAIEATRWWELEPEELALATRDNPGFLRSPSIEGAQAFLKALGRPPFIPGAARQDGASPSS